MSDYCTLALHHPVHHRYHAHEYGYPQEDDTVLFERLCLEIMQAGLSWELVLKRRAGMNKAFANFNPRRVAKFDDQKIAALLDDERIIRNRLKILSIIHNAQVVVGLGREGGLSGWLKQQHPQTKPEWVKAMRQTFRFMGPEIVGEFLMSVAYLPGSHHEKCPVFRHIQRLHPPWLLAEKSGFRYATKRVKLKARSP